MTLAPTGSGELLEHVETDRDDDPHPMLTLVIRIPVRIADDAAESRAATLSVRLMHPEVDDWRAAEHRTYRFDGSTRRYTKADGETIALDDVFGGLRTDSEHFNVAVAQVAFGAFDGTGLPAHIEGTVRSTGAQAPFALDALLLPGRQPSNG